ncbi:unnamed protein product [Owenia fusiformis]|uniref:Uncharacterized protein n=1 Tax=Owenia fusiformis TaxID=6347 RepID=A0A8S4NB95_OWEFU|nr:unnamed protein product [Owenia fusiformis]
MRELEKTGRRGSSAMQAHQCMALVRKLQGPTPPSSQVSDIGRGESLRQLLGTLLEEMQNVSTRLSRIEAKMLVQEERKNDVVFLDHVTKGKTEEYCCGKL